MAKNNVKIGAVCDATGVTPRTIRHYESLGLLAPASRTGGGQKLYDPAAADTVRAVRILQDAGYSLDEVRRLVDLSRRAETDGKSLTTRLRATVKTLHRALAARVLELEQARDRVSALTKATAGCDRCPGTACRSCGSLARLRTLGLTNAPPAA